jgi:hypothetical protein
MSRTLIESNNYRETITEDGIDTGIVIGNMSATTDSTNKSISISASLNCNATLPADSVIQQQLTDFIANIRTQASNAGLSQFGEAASK